MLTSAPLLAGLYCAILSSELHTANTLNPKLSSVWAVMKMGTGGVCEQELCQILCTDHTLATSFAQAFEHTTSLQHQVPRICTHARINPARVARFVNTITHFSLVYIPHTDQRGCIYAISDGTIAGYVRFGRESTRYHLFLLKVLPTYRNQGLGSALLLSAYAAMATDAHLQGTPRATIYWEAIAQEHDHGLPQEQLIHFYRAHGARFEKAEPDEFNSMVITIPTQ